MRLNAKHGIAYGLLAVLAIVGVTMSKQQHLAGRLLADAEDMCRCFCLVGGQANPEKDGKDFICPLDPGPNKECEDRFYDYRGITDEGMCLAKNRRPCLGYRMIVDTKNAEGKRLTWHWEQDSPGQLSCGMYSVVKSSSSARSSATSDCMQKGEGPCLFDECCAGLQCVTSENIPGGICGVVPSSVASSAGGGSTRGGSSPAKQ
jgi:hypothetical protein